MKQYLEKRLGIVKHGFMQGFSLRNFSVFGQPNRFSDRGTFWTQNELFSVNKMICSQNVFATWGQNPEKITF